MKSFKILIFLVLIGTLSAGTVTYDYNIYEPKVREFEQYSVFEFENSVLLGKIGEPNLPYLGVSLLLPQGEKAVSVIVTGSDLVTLTGEHTLMPAQPYHILSSKTLPQFVHAESQTYKTDVDYPMNIQNGLKTQYLSGFSIGYTAVCPLVYNPVQRTVSYYNKLHVEIITERDAEALDALKFLKNDNFVSERVEKNVDNPFYISMYNLPQTRTDNLDYLIITEQSRVDIWQEFAQIHLNRGLYAEVAAVEDISSGYIGIDLQDKIRNFIIDKYSDYLVKFVLLAGDVDVIPHRGLYGEVNNGDTQDYDIPADMYYSGLDGTWNSDNDDKWGEPYEADLSAELAIGRIPYNTDEEIENFINKVTTYLNSPIVSELEDVMFAGEYLWEGPTWGGDYMDEMIGGSSTHGHTTVGVPADWNISTLYERDGAWGSTEVCAEFSEGPNLVNHLGHSSTDYTMHLNTPQVTDSAITNNGLNNNFSVLFTQGCYPGAFDNRFSNGSYGNDCIGEKFLSISNGLAAMIANSRYGWGQQGSTGGASQFFHREYIDALFGENIIDLGYALADSKLDAIPFMAPPGISTVLYWCSYETNLLGDPGMTIWTQTPDDINANYSPALSLGATELYVETDVLGAKVAILKDGELIASQNTGLGGNANVHFESIQEICDIEVYITAENHLVHYGIVSVLASDIPYVICSQMELNELAGNIDGVVQANDLISVDMEFSNIGMSDTGDAITATISSLSNLITINISTVEIGGLEPSETLLSEDAFEFVLLAGIADDTDIPITLTITSDENTWQTDLDINVHAPVLGLAGFTIVPEGDDNDLNPGENAALSLNIENTGSGYSYNINTIIYTFDTYCTITGEDLINSINPDESQSSSVPFQLSVSADCPEDHIIELEYMFFDELGVSCVGVLSIPLGTQGYTFENGIGDWTHESLSGGYSDQWHLSTANNHTESGSYSLKCGGAGSSDYASLNHSGLVSPEIYVAPDSYISFYHWIAAETDNGNEAWDGGLIEISQNGSEWESITPVGGYPYTIVDNDESPFAPGTPVFSGNINWQEVELDVSDYSGIIQLRFVFGSDGYVSDEGWYIDDVTIGSYTSEDDEQIVPVVNSLFQNYPNPFNPNTTISFSLTADSAENAELVIFNVKGQRVKTFDYNSHPGFAEGSVTWNGKDENNKSVSSGIYMYKLKSGEFTSTKKMMLLK